MRSSSSPATRLSSATSSRSGSPALGRPHAAVGRGRRRGPGSNQNRLPLPGALSTRNSPPIRSTRRLHMNRPRPVPPKRREVDASAWVKPSKMRCCCSALMPMPVSATSTRRRTRWASCARRRKLTRTCPRAVNFSALPARLMRICCRRRRSPTTALGSSGSMSKITSTSLSPWLPESTTARSCISGSSSKGSISRTSLPASIFE